MNEIKEMNPLNQIKLRLKGYVYVGERFKEGWREPISHYMFICYKHGYVVDYPHGYDERLECPRCRAEKRDLL